MKLSTSILFVLLLVTGLSNAQQKTENQNSYVSLGQKAVMDGKFKQAVIHLEKAMPAEKSNPQVLYMLAYSYYHSGEYAKAVSTFGQVVSIRPNETSAYYYRGKARNVLGAQMNSTLTPVEREKLLSAAIRDFSKAIELSPDDIKVYQNRAIAYRDYGILKGQKIPKLYDKAAAVSSFKACINDLQRLLDVNPARKDIADEMKKAKVYMANLDN
ncbi:tetratricopeptide repeat protein [Desertivirga xinjiangensis]|uniref:tetratricopeptide repeat protein n=1 Tax=Desertivirga xinjiangensis TaxID=539206 RepID=UPI00210EC4CF|nr:tetratricopeptide repeat protein [Pedobacter xinjiangensis]